MLTLRTDLNRKITASELDANFTYLLQQIQSSTGSVATTFTDVTYSELVQKIGSSELVPGTFYQITDYKTAYDQPDYDYDYSPTYSETSYKVGPTNSLVVLAIDNNKISNQAWQPDFPNDFIKWDWTWDQTEVTGGTAFGRITERIDEFNNRTDYDHRNVVFKRYKHYKYDRNFPMGGTLSITNIGTYSNQVIGYGTTFSELSADGFINFYNKTWKIDEIIDDNNMIISGVSTFTGSVYDWYESYPVTSNLPGDLYYFNDWDSDNFSISDGGMDMYDGANIMLTELENQIPYTHTQVEAFDDFVGLTIPDFLMDGSIVGGLTSSAIFGTGSSYFTNLYPGLFVMCAATVSVDRFGIDGNIGTDGNGMVDVLQFTHSVGENVYSAFVKRVYDTNDPSINQIIIVPGELTGITQSYDETTEDDTHILDGLSGRDKIYYLLMALREGVKLTDLEVEGIVSDFLDLADGLSLESLLTELNSNYELVTSTKALEFLYTSTAMSNIVDDDYREYPLFVGSASNNWFGNVANLYPNRSDFILANNVFIGESNKNHVKDLFLNNTICSYCYDNNIGIGFISNQIFGEMNNNKIGNYFENNTFYNVIESCVFENYTVDNNIIGNMFNNKFGDNIYYNTFTIFDGSENNIIGKNFEENLLKVIWFGNNNIGNFFVGNRLDSGEFSNNNIKSEFYNNNINVGIFYENNLINSFGNNIIFGESFGENTTNKFNDNNIDNSFARNHFLNDFQNNINDGLEIVDNIFECNISGFSLNASSASELLTSPVTAHVSKNELGVETIWWINSGGTVSSATLD